MEKDNANDYKEKVEFVEITSNRIIKIYWSIFWRESLVVLVAAIEIGIISAIATLTTNINRMLINLVGNIIIGIVDILISIYLIKIVLKKKYKDFKIVLIKPSDLRDGGTLAP